MKIFGVCIEKKVGCIVHFVIKKLCGAENAFSWFDYDHRFGLKKSKYILQRWMFRFQCKKTERNDSSIEINNEIKIQAVFSFFYSRFEFYEN